MHKSKELSNTTKIVKAILMEYEEARNSDMVLYVKVCERMNSTVLKQPFWEAITSLKAYNLPCIESVGRARRKLQREFPELSGNAKVEAQRAENEEIFREYARGNV
jgi:hypothetical protein